MRTITLVIHQEDNTWWAESPELPGFSAAADSLDELRAEAADGIAFHFDDQAFLVAEAFAAADAVAPTLWKTTISNGFAYAFGRARGGVVATTAVPTLAVP